MKKLLFCFSVILILFLCITINVNAKEVTTFYRYLNVSLGETYETAGVNYQSNVAGTKVVYSENSSFSNAKTINPTETKWHFDKIDTSSDSSYDDFKERFICKAQLNDLQENTKYYYKVTYQNNESPVYSFVSGSSSKTKTTFGFVTDTQAYGQYYSRANTAITNMLAKKPDTSFLLVTGDIVDRGGIENEWINFFDNTKAIQNIAWATIPGNHEYYHSSASGYVSAEIYNQFLNNPNNGPQERLNSTYYFRYNNILFIMLDTIRSDAYTETKEWFKTVVDENPSDYIFVGMHSGPYSLGYYASAAQSSYSKFNDLFEECGVDMVFSGHEHIFAYTFPMLNKQKNESGITYVIGSAGGNKSSNPDNYTQAEQKKWYQENKDFFEYYSVRNLSTCSIDVDGSTIKVTLIDEQGNEVKSFERTGGVEKAKKYANSVVNEKSNTSNLNERYYDEVNNIKDEFNKKMNNATSKLDIDNARKEASDKLDLIIEKNKACKEVENRYDSSKYYDPQLQELNNIIKNGINSIDSAIEINDIKDKQTNTFVAIGKVPTKTIIDNKTNDLLIFSQDIILKDLSTKQEEDYTKFVDEKMNELKQVVSTIDLDDKYNQLTIEIETYYNELTAKKSGCKNAKDSIIYIIAALSLLSISLLFGFKKKD